MVHKIYERYERPLVRVVRGLPTLWEPVIATVYNSDGQSICGAVWSPCNRFIAVAKHDTVEIRDAATLALLNTFESPTSWGSSINFSPDSCSLARVATGCCISWDLKTGSSVGIDLAEGPNPSRRYYRPRPVYSTDGEMVAFVSFDGRDAVELFTYDLSTTRTHRCSVSQERVILPIWTHGEFLRFATAESDHITIWQVDFTLTHPPEVVESLPIPDKIPDFAEVLFLPTPPRIAFSFYSTLVVWDARDSKLLLNISYKDPSHMSFSSDGLFFACLFGRGGEFCVWKESLSGYIVHQQPVFSFAIHGARGPFLSPDGASNIVCLDSTIHLLRTKDPIPFRGRPVPVINSCRDFVLEFSPSDALAAFTDTLANTVTVLCLQSGDPRLVIDTGMEVRCLGMTGSTIVVAGEERVAVWNLVAGEARAGVDDSVQVATFNLSQPSPFGHLYWGKWFFSMSLSPDLGRIATLGYDANLQSPGVEIHDVSTARCLASVASGTAVLSSPSTPDGSKVTDASEGVHVQGIWFTPDGREILGASDDGSVDRWEVIEDEEFGTTRLQSLGDTTSAPGVFPWQSPCGYEITDGGWILSPTRKRLLWLPHEWRSGERSRTWSGRFLGLKNYLMPDVVILECID